MRRLHMRDLCGINAFMGTEEQSLLDEMAARHGNSLLDNDDVPNANQSLICFSCEEPMEGLYCYACGNKNDNYRRSIWSLGVELFQSMTAFEGRIWRSLYSLIFKPGQMARDFADGARQKWTSPIRLFLATSLLLFGYISLSETQMVVLGDLKDTTHEKSNLGGAIRLGDDDTEFTQSLLFFVKQSDLKVPPDNRAEMQMSSMMEGFRSGWQDYGNESNLREIIEELNEQIETASDEERQALLVVKQMLEARLASLTGDEDASREFLVSDTELREALENLSEDDGTSMIITGADGQQINLDQQGVADLYDRLLRNPQIINNQLNTKLKWAMFFMMPFAMFMGAIFIRGRDTAMLYDHLVHAAYVHSFSFLLLFAFILLSQYTSIPGLIVIYTLILMIYLPISVKRAFRRGWFKSFLTAYGVGAIYTVIISIIAFVIIVFALSSVAREFDRGGQTPPTIEATPEEQIEAPDPQTTTESPPSPQTQPPQ